MMDAKNMRKLYAETLLRQTFAPSYLEIIDESGLHAGHQKELDGQAETHFRIKITSQHFSGKSRLEIHRMINEVLKPIIDDGLHALAIEARPLHKDIFG